MIRRATSGLLATACVASSCTLYDAALLDEARGGAKVGDGDGDDSSPTGGAGSGGVEGGGGGGGSPGGGGDSGDNTGGGTSGGSGGTDSGGGTGTGGVPCVEPSGTRGPLTDETSLIENFNQAWANIGSGAPYTGSWFVAVDANGSGISNKIQDAYELDPCSAAGDTSLHVVGEGYTVWGASFDANLMFNVTPVDVSEFEGVTFWARSDDANLLKLGFSDGDESNGETPIESTPLFIQSTWTQHWVTFPEAVNTEQLTVLHIVAIADQSFDFWIDDLAFFAQL